MKSKEIDFDDDIDFSEDAFNKSFRRIEGDELIEHKARIDRALRSTKSRITIYLDTDVVGHFKTIAERDNAAYQTLINDALRTLVDDGKEKLIKQELKSDLLKDKKFLNKLKTALAR